MEFWKDYEAVKELIKLVTDSKVDFKWEKDDGCKIEIKAADKKPPRPMLPPQQMPMMPMMPQQQPMMQIPQQNAEQPVNVIPVTSQGEAAMPQENDEAFKIVTSPLVGTFYSAASPDDEPFVKVGDKISKGQKLGIIEAMKLMNDIESDYDGEIVEIMVSNESMVEYGQPLFKIR